MSESFQPQDLQRFKETKDIFGGNAAAEELFQVGNRLAAQINGTLTEAVCLASLISSTLSKAEIKEKLKQATQKLLKHATTQQVAMEDLCHPAILSEVTRWLREN